MKKIILKLIRSLSKITLPILFKILINLKLNRRIINFLSDEGYKSNNRYNFNKVIENLLRNQKITALDVKGIKVCLNMISSKLKPESTCKPIGL